MSGRFQHNLTSVHASQTQSDVMSDRSKPLTVNSNSMPPATAFTKMPVTTSSLLRIPTLQEFQSLPSLPFPVTFPNAHGAYLFTDNGYVTPHSTYIKEEKIDPYIKEEKISMYIKEEKIDPVPASATPLSIGAQQQPHRPPSHSSTPSPRSASYSPIGDCKKNKKREESVLQRSSTDYEKQGLNLSDKSVTANNMTSLMLVAVPPYQQNSSSRTGVGRNPSPGIPTVVLANHHHQILRYPPNGDALLSASAISYGDSEMLPESGFDVHVGNSLGSLDDGLLSTNLTVSGSGGSTATFDLFDEEAGHESYMGDGNQALQLSPHAFPNNGEAFSLNDNSNLSGVPDQASDGTTGSENASTVCPTTGNKLAVTTITENRKSKSRPLKASSPNRTTTQTCQVCGKVFSNSSALAKHKLTHSDERKYVCQLCTKAFKRQDHLNGHLLTHMNKKPYECKVEGCGKSYCDARSLRRHTENHHSSASQAAMAAATAATVNAIAVRVGAPLTLPRNLAFGGDSKIETNGTSFLANALQSDRIRYAPPPTTSVVTRPTAPPPPPYNATSVSATTTTTETMDKMTSSAASHLQLLAFQQHDQHQSGEQTSLMPWQQPPPPNSSILYINSPLGQQTYCDEQQQTAARPQHSNDRPSSKPSEIADPYLAQGAEGNSSTNHIQNPATTSVLAQCLKLGLPSQVQLSQNSASSITGQHIPLGDLLPQGNVLHAVGTQSSSSQQLAADLSQTLQLRNQWMQTTGYPLASGANATAGLATAATFVVEPKPVECNICQRKFKNIPALNGHMRLHGGYLKKEIDGSKKMDKRLDSKPHQPPLQTASMNIRALIEEKIIQRRIVNPPLNIPIPPPPPSLHPSVTMSIPSPPSHTLMTSSAPTSYTSSTHAAGSLTLHNTSCPSEGDELMDFSDSCIPESDSAHPLTQHEHQCNQQEQQQQQYEPQMHRPPHPETSPVPHPLEQLQETQHQFQQPHNIDSSSYSSDMKMEEDAQSDMQRQIEIIKQGLMSHQPISEKFRRHSDSDHFLAPRTYLGSMSSPSFIDFLRRKVVGKRTQRTGSDPGEFAVSSFDGMFPSSLVEEMDDECQSGGDAEASGNPEIPEELPVTTDSLPPSEMIDFEISVGMGDPLPAQLSLPSLIRNDTPLMESTLSSTTNAVLTNYNTIPSSTEMNYEDISVDNTVANACSTIPKVKVEDDDDVFLSPSSIPTSPIRTKKKHRPEPLYIPPQVNTCGFQSRLRSPRLWDPISAGRISSPPPYTPPPMLSPVRSGSGLFWHVISGSGSLTPISAPLTPGRLGLVPEYATTVGLPEEEEEISEPPETDIQPHVNIGPQFQAKLPVLHSNLKGYEPKFDDLVWDPKSEEGLSDKEVEMYLQFACCAAIPGGGRNKEYALHVLQMADGNIKDAMLKLMDPNPKLHNTHPLLTYPYAESDKWTPDEIDSYQQALMTCDKDFFCISQEVKSKTVKQCIQFYYLWKKICPDEYKRLRVARRKRELDGTQYNLRSKIEDGAHDGDSPKSGDPAPSPGRTSDVSGDRFACDYPECFASFSSRQALNGHIRIHGGNSTTKSTSHPNGNQSRSPANNEDSGGQAYSPSTNPASNASTQYGESIEEFPCKICGKVFFKVKSRSAHMKSHRPVDPDRQK